MTWTQTVLACAARRDPLFDHRARRPSALCRIGVVGAANLRALPEDCRTRAQYGNKNRNDEGGPRDKPHRRCLQVGELLPARRRGTVSTRVSPAGHGECSDTCNEESDHERSLHVAGSWTKTVIRKCRVGRAPADERSLSSASARAGERGSCDVRRPISPRQPAGMMMYLLVRGQVAAQVAPLRVPVAVTCPVLKFARQPPIAGWRARSLTPRPRRGPPGQRAVRYGG